MTEGVVQRVAATTHSYSIQMTISASGELLSPLFVCITEASGDFPKTIQLFGAPNIYAVASKSPMFTKLLLLKWFSEVYFPNVPDSSLLILDSWCTYKDDEARNNVTPDGKSGKVIYPHRLMNKFFSENSHYSSEMHPLCTATGPIFLSAI